MQLTSSAFEYGGMIPQRYGQDGDDVNPPLLIDDVPEGAVSLALVIDDPDIPPQAGVPVWDHWVVFNIPPHTREIPSGWSGAGVRGVGTRGKLDYSGPKPPDKEHRYFFKLYALDAELNLPEGSTKADLEQAMQDHILAKTTLMGRFAPSV